MVKRKVFLSAVIISALSLAGCGTLNEPKESYPNASQTNNNNIAKPLPTDTETPGATASATPNETESPKPKPTVTKEPAPKPSVSTKPKPQTQPTAKPAPKPSVTSKPNSKPKTTTTKPKSAPKPAPKPSTVAKPKPKQTTPVKPKTTTKPETKPTTPAKPKPKPTTPAKPKPKPKPTTPAKPKPPASTGPKLGSASGAKQLITLVNKERSAKGLKSFAHHSDLDKAAKLAALNNNDGLMSLHYSSSWNIGNETTSKGVTTVKFNSNSISSCWSIMGTLDCTLSASEWMGYAKDRNVLGGYGLLGKYDGIGTYVANNQITFYYANKK